MLISADDEFIRITFCNLVTNPSMDVPSAHVGRSPIQIQSLRTACYWPRLHTPARRAGVIASFPPLDCNLAVDRANALPQRSCLQRMGSTVSRIGRELACACISPLLSRDRCARACRKIYTLNALALNPLMKAFTFSLRLLTAPLPARCSRPCQVY